MKQIFLLASLTSALIVGGCGGGRDHTPVIATVGSQEIHRSEFDRFTRLKMGELAAGDVTDALRSQMLDEYLIRRLVLEEAARAGVTVTEAEIDQAAQDNPQLKSTAAAGETRRELAADLLVAKYYRQIVLRDVRVSPEEAQKYIDRNRARLTDRPGFDVREIRVDNRDEAERLRRELTEGQRDFASLARQQSQAPNAEQGGLARYVKGQLPDVLEKAIEPLRPGDVSPVVQSNFGFHIFKLERRIQPRSGAERRSGFDERGSELIEEAIARKNQQAVDAAIDGLERSTPIKIDGSALGFTYNGRLMHN